MDNHKVEVGSEWIGTNNGLDYVCVSVSPKGAVFNCTLINEEYYQTTGEIQSNLKPKPVERVVWMNVYNGYVLTYPTKEMADSHACSSRLFCQRVVIKDSDDE